MAEWRAQTPREQELLEAALQFDFLGRAEVAAQVTGARVSEDCGCGCGSFKVEVPSGSPTVPAGGSVGDVYGRDDAGTLVGLFFYVAGGFVRYVECYGLDGNPVSLPQPTSLAQATPAILDD